MATETKPAGRTSSVGRRSKLLLTSGPETEGLNLRERAYRWLREEIVTGRLPFGAVLSPRKLGLKIGMSFLPVSDALQRLEAERLVESRDRVGTRVRVPTVEDISGIYTVREALESQAARLCCERATREQRSELRTLAKDVDARYLACDQPGVPYDQWLETNTLHIRLHRAISEAAHCPRLSEELERSQVLTLKFQFDSALGRKKRPRNWHSTLIKGILQPDPAAADLAARTHVQYGIEEVIQAVGRLEVDGRWRV